MDTEKIKNEVLSDLTGLTTSDRKKIANGEIIYNIDLLTLLQIAAIITQILSIVIPWWRNRKSSLLARYYIYRETQKALSKTGLKISSFSVSNSIYKALNKER